jgi:hypothetical protein
MIPNFSINLSFAGWNLLRTRPIGSVHDRYHRPYSTMAPPIAPIAVGCECKHAHTLVGDVVKVSASSKSAGSDLSPSCLGTQSIYLIPICDVCLACRMNVYDGLRNANYAHALVGDICPKYPFFKITRGVLVHRHETARVVRLIHHIRGYAKFGRAKSELCRAIMIS